MAFSKYSSLLCIVREPVSRLFCSALHLYLFSVSLMLFPGLCHPGSPHHTHTHPLSSHRMLLPITWLARPKLIWGFCCGSGFFSSPTPLTLARVPWPMAATAHPGLAHGPSLLLLSRPYPPPLQLLPWQVFSQLQLAGFAPERVSS